MPLPAMFASDPVQPYPPPPLQDKQNLQHQLSIVHNPRSPPQKRFQLLLNRHLPQDQSVAKEGIEAAATQITAKSTKTELSAKNRSTDAAKVLQAITSTSAKTANGSTIIGSSKVPAPAIFAMAVPTVIMGCSNNYLNYSNKSWILSNNY
jgi:hypothetical protein